MSVDCLFITPQQGVYSSSIPRINTSDKNFPVIKSSLGLRIYTLQANTLPAFVYGNVKKIKGEIPISAITPVMEHVRRNIPVLIEYESIGLLMDYVFFVSPSNFASEVQSYKKVKNVY